jgi:hypothetical protein
MKNSNEIIVPQDAGVAVLSESRQWLAQHGADIARYNAWAGTSEPYAQRVRRWRQSQACKLVEADGAV